MTKELSALMNKIAEFILKGEHVYVNTRNQLKLDLMGWPERVKSIEYALLATKLKLPDIPEYNIYCGKPEEQNQMACMIRIVFNMYDVQLRNRIRGFMAVLDVEPKPRMSQAELAEMNFNNQARAFRDKLTPDLWDAFDSLLKNRPR